MKKTTTSVTSAKKNNGIDSRSLRQFKSAKRMLETHPYQAAQLYHLCFVGSNQVKPYTEAIKSLVEHLRDKKMPCQYRAALEENEDDGSNEVHMHVFLLVEAKHAMPIGVINRRPDGWLKEMAMKKGIDFHLNHPRSPLHFGRQGQQKLYASLPASKPEKLADCINWISYLYKARSKPKIRQRYFSSRPTREIRLQAVLPQGEASIGNLEQEQDDS